jgi:uncharacterized protein
MPLLMCPNCNASMNEVKRHDVAFDMCPTCRGVWLDRGELEKIIASVQGESGGFDRGAPERGGGYDQGRRDRDDRRRRRDNDDDDDRGFNILDIFGD